MGLPASGWERAAAIAASVMPAEEWRQELARAVRDACGLLAVYATMFTCPPGDWLALRAATDPDDHVDHIAELAGYLPWIDRVGSWRVVLARQGIVSAPMDLGIDRDLTHEINQAVLRPRGVRGMLAGYCLDERGD